MVFTNTSNCGGLSFACVSSAIRGSNNKLSVVVKGPAAIICEAPRAHVKYKILTDAQYV